MNETNDENLVFGGESSNQPSNSAPIQNNSSISTSQSIPVQTPQPEVNPNQPENITQASMTPPILPPAPPPIDDEETVLFTRGNVIKILLGLFVLFVIGFILFLVFSPKGKPKVENVTLTYWGLWEDKNVMQPIISDFEKNNPNIKVNYIKQDAKQYKERLLVRMKNNTGPDIFRFHNSWTPTITDILLPLPSDVIKKEDFQTVFYPVAKEDLIRNGAIYGIPLQIDTLALFVNTEILQGAGVAVPTNWDEFSKAAISLTVKDETNKIKTAGAALGTYSNVTHAPDILSLLFAQNGVNFQKMSDTSQNVIDAFKFYTSFVKDENVWNETLDESLLAFSKGNLAMYFGYSWDIFSIKYYNPELNFQVYPVPRLTGRNRTIASYWVEGVSNKTKYPKETFLFMSYLAKKETQQKLFSEESKTRMFGELYSRTDLAESLKSNNTIYPFVNQAKDATSSFFVSNTNDEGFNEKLNNYLKDVINAINSNTSIETAASTFLLGVEQVLGEYQK